MTWTIQTHNILRVGSLDDARRVWGEAKQWRSVPDHIRQLDGSRKKHIKIIKLSEDRGFECVLYNTPVVTYYTDGCVALRCHDSQSTTAFAWRVAPYGCSPSSVSGRMFWCCKSPDGDRYYRQSKAGPIALSPAGSRWEIKSDLNVQQEWAHDHKLGAAVRKQLSPYKVWYDLTKRLGCLPQTKPQRHYVRESARALLRGDVPTVFSYQELFERAGTPDEILPIAYELAGARYKTQAPFTRLPRSLA